MSAAVVTSDVSLQGAQVLTTVEVGSLGSGGGLGEDSREGLGVPAVSLWHFEHMSFVEGLPKKPQPLAH